MIKLLPTAFHPEGQGMAKSYQINQNKIFEVSGSSRNPTRHMFEMRGNKIYPSINHPEGKGQSRPWFELRGDKIYNTVYHPHGSQPFPWYEKKDK